MGIQKINRIKVIRKSTPEKNMSASHVAVEPFVLDIQELLAQEESEMELKDYYRLLGKLMREANANAKIAEVKYHNYGMGYRYVMEANNLGTSYVVHLTQEADNPNQHELVLYCTKSSSTQVHYRAFLGKNTSYLQTCTGLGREFVQKFMALLQHHFNTK